MKGLFYIGLMLLLAGCDKVDAGRGEDDGRVYPVSFTLAGFMETRADGDGENALKAGDSLTIAAYDPNPPRALVAAGQYKVNSSANGLELVSGQDSMYLPVGTYDFCAMTPKQTLTGDGKDGRHGTIKQGVDALGSVTQAQMGATSTPVVLKDLDHLASQISFIVQVVPQKLDSVASFAVQTIEIGGMVASKENNYLLPDNLLEIPETGAADRFETLTIGGTDAFTTGDKGTGAGPGFINTQKTPLIVFPKAASTFNAVIEVKIKKAQAAALDTGSGAEGEEETIKLNAKINRLAFEPGKRYKFEVNYGWDYVRFSITAADWTTVKDGSQVGDGEQTVNHEIKIGQWGEDIDLVMTI